MDKHIVLKNGGCKLHINTDDFDDITVRDETYRRRVFTKIFNSYSYFIREFKTYHKVVEENIQDKKVQATVKVFDRTICDKYRKFVRQQEKLWRKLDFDLESPECISIRDNSINLLIEFNANYRYIITIDFIKKEINFIPNN